MDNDYYTNGPYLGIVSDNKDPDKLGRVRVKMEVFGDMVETDWLPFLTFFAGRESGAFFLPDVDDQVVVAFMGDNPENGIVLGSIWSDTNPPPECDENNESSLNKDGKNNLKYIKSRSGHRIILDDTEGDEKLQIINGDSKCKIEFNSKDNSLNIHSENELTIKSGGKIKIEADEGELKFNKSLKIEGNDISLNSENKNIEIKAGQNIVIDGKTIKLN